MARESVQVPTDLGDDGDFSSLDRAVQWAYFMLMTQPNVSTAGVLPVTLGRWSRMSIDATPERIAASMGALEDAGFLRWDRKTEEVLLPSYMQDNRVLDQPNMLRAAWNEAAAGIFSRHIRAVVVAIIEPHLPDGVEQRRGRPRTKVPAPLRRAVFERDGWACQYCGRSFAPRTAAEREGVRAPMIGWDFLEIDHVFPHSLGGELTLDNAKAACSPCNRSKSNKILTI